MLDDAWFRVNDNLFLDWLEKPLWNRRRGWIWWRRGWRNPIYKRGLPRNIFIRGWVMLCDSFNREKLYNCFEILSSSMWSSCQLSKFIVSSDMLMPNKSCIKSRWMQTNDRNYQETSSSEAESCSVTASIAKNYTIVLKYCHLPCGHPASTQSSLCLRTCSCPINHVLNSGECKPMTESTKNMINENSDKNIEHENSSPRDKRKYLSKMV